MAALSFDTPEEDHQEDWYHQHRGCLEEIGISRNLAWMAMAVCYDFGSNQAILQY